MSIPQSTGATERFLRRYEYDDHWVVAAELGVADDAIDVDVLGTTAIIVVDTPEGVRETEFELPGPAADITVRNGVLSITVSK